MDSHYMDGHGLATRDGFSWSDDYVRRLGLSHWHGGGTEFLSSSVPRASRLRLSEITCTLG